MIMARQRPAPTTPDASTSPASDSTNLTDQSTLLLGGKPNPTEPTDLRLLLTRQLLASAVRRYREALATVDEIERLHRDSFDYSLDRNDKVQAEFDLWTNLLVEAVAGFRSADRALGNRLNGAGHRQASDVSNKPFWRSNFVERAVSLDGFLYVLTADPAKTDPGENLVIVLPAEFVTVLD
jgi:hypothetical protein